MVGQPTLSPRLRLLADWVPASARLADVGTDHGQLPVWLLCQGRITSAIASDLREGPLQRAMETGQRYGVSHIQYRLCEGLHGIHPEECDTIVIAGMGGEKIAGILRDAPWTVHCTLLLQPMTRAEELRSFLADNGYAIRREALVQDRGTLYPVLEASGGQMFLTLGQQYGGAKLDLDPLADQYRIEKIIACQRAIAGLHRAADPTKANALRDIVTALLELREEWRHVNCSGTGSGTV